MGQSGDEWSAHARVPERPGCPGRGIQGHER